MDIGDGNENEIAAYESRPLDNLTVQDALVIIAVYVAQIDPEVSRKDIKRIEEIIEKCSACTEKKEGIFSRIHKNINLLRVVEPLKAVEVAAKTLIPDFREAAFKVAVEIAMTDKILTAEKKTILDTLAAKLSVGDEFVKKMVENFS